MGYDAKNAFLASLVRFIGALTVAYDAADLPTFEAAFKAELKSSGTAFNNELADAAAGVKFQAGTFHAGVYAYANVVAPMHDIILDTAKWLYGKSKAPKRTARGQFITDAQMTTFAGTFPVLHPVVPQDAERGTDVALHYPVGADRRTTDRLDDGAGTVKAMTAITDKAHQLYLLGKIRLDTKFIRNIVFINNVYRTISLILRKSMAYVGDDVANGMPAITDRMTEFHRNQARSTKDKSRIKNHWKRYDY